MLLLQLHLLLRQHQQVQAQALQVQVQAQVQVQVPQHQPVPVVQQVRQLVQVQQQHHKLWQSYLKVQYRLTAIRKLK